MASLDVQASADRHIHLRIRLGKSDTVIPRRGTTQVEIPILLLKGCPELASNAGTPISLGKNGVRTEHEIEDPPISHVLPSATTGRSINTLN